MNKAELTELVQKSLGKDASKAYSERCVNIVLDCIGKGFKKDKAVQIVGFGTFTVKNRKARTGRNPQTGETIPIKASKGISFKAGQKLKDALN